MNDTRTIVIIDPLPENPAWSIESRPDSLVLKGIRATSIQFSPTRTVIPKETN